jgi:zinc protease
MRGVAPARIAALGLAAGLVSAGYFSPAFAATAVTSTAVKAVGPAAAAGNATPIEVPSIAYRERRLANGLQVISVQDRSSPTVSVQVWYHVGAKDDPPGRSGFAHLFEHLMFKGTRYLKAEQIDRLTEDVGGANNAFTSDDVTAYQDIVPSNHLETLLWAEAERMGNLDVVQQSFVSERAVVEEEYRQRVLASPYGRFGRAVASLPYRVHPYQRPSIGSIEDLEAASLADVTRFHATYYRPDNATVVVAGDFDPQQLDAWVDRYFAPIPQPPGAVPRVTETEPPWPADRRIALTGPQVALPAVALAWLAPPVTAADAAPLRIAAALLGGGDSARLNESLVYRRRLAAQAGFEADLRAGPGLLVATAIAAGGMRLADVEAGLFAEVQRLAREPAGAAELAKVKTQMLTDVLLSRQTPQGLGAAVADAAVLGGGAGQVNAEIAALQAVSAVDVERVLRRYVLGAHRVTIEYTQAGAPR